jgi:GTP-binding protein HflX
LDFDFFDDSVKISALTGEGIDDLLEAISNALPQNRKRVQILLPFNKLNLATFARTGIVHFEEYKEDGLFLDATVEIQYLKELNDYIV